MDAKQYAIEQVNGDNRSERQNFKNSWRQMETPESKNLLDAEKTNSKRTSIVL